MKTFYGKCIDLQYNQFIDSWHILIEINKTTYLEGTLPEICFRKDQVSGIIGRPIEIPQMYFDWYEHHIRTDDDTDDHRFERVRAREEWCHEIVDDLWDDFEIF